VLGFGADSNVKITHDPDDGLYLKSTDTDDDNPFLLTLQTGETAIDASDVLGVINFQAPDEADGKNALLIGAVIEAVAEYDFTATENHTKLVFKTARMQWLQRGCRSVAVVWQRFQVELHLDHR